MELSIVVPIYNEEENIAYLHEQLTSVLDPLGRDYEIICVDDGSTDHSFQLLQELAERDARLKVVSFRRNFGQTAAFSAGFDYAQGEIVITIDADLQNDPASIPRLLDRMEEGYDVVSGWRVNRRDPFLTRRLPSMMANWLITKTTGVSVRDRGCSLRAHRREVIKQMRLYGELHRFIPDIASWIGVTMTEVPVNHRPRRFGRSKYGLSRTWRVTLDLITVRFLLSYSTRPIHIFGSLGLIALLVGMGLGVYLSVLKLAFGEQIGNRPLLMLSVLLMTVGMQMVAMGLLGELIVRTYHESQNKPIYTVRQIVDRSGLARPDTAQ